MSYYQTSDIDAVKYLWYKVGWHKVGWHKEGWHKELTIVKYPKNIHNRYYKGEIRDFYAHKRNFLLYYHPLASG